MAACSAGVLVSAPQNSPATAAGVTENAAWPSQQTPIPTRCDSSTSPFTFSPKGLAMPLKNCFPYWIPTPYTNRTRPSEPTSAGGAAFGESIPTASPTKSTAPAPSAKPRTFTPPSAYPSPTTRNSASSGCCSRNVLSTSIIGQLLQQRRPDPLLTRGESGLAPTRLRRHLSHRP